MKRKKILNVNVNKVRQKQQQNTHKKYPNDLHTGVNEC